MSHREAILEVLEKFPQGVCDDCLAQRTGIHPRQQVNQLCRRMDGKTLVRRQGPCAVCGRRKVVNVPLAQRHEPPTGAVAVPSRVTQEFPIEKLRNQLDRFCRALARKHGFTCAKDTLAALIDGLHDHEIVPGLQAAMMHTIRGLRNVYVHEHVRLGPHEVAVAEHAWASIQEWAERNEPELWRQATG